MDIANRRLQVTHARPAAVGVETQIHRPILLRSLATAVAPAALMGLACLIRLVPVLSSNFPLGDGGLFYLMVKTLQHSGYALPTGVAYNGRALPFAYPPLGFYVTGRLADLMGMPLLTAMRILPLAVSIMTVGAVALLARSMLTSRAQVLGAVFAFGALPLSFRYFIMGAGITRAPGLLFAVLTIWQAHLLYSRRQTRFVLPTTLFAALTILSHPNATWFAAYSVGLLLVCFGRSRIAVFHSALVAIGCLALTAPWWVTIIHRYGMTPFLGASQSGSPGDPSWLLLLEFRFSAEPLYPMLLTAGVLGVVCCLRDRRFWLPVWLVLSFVLDTRYGGTFGMVPLALLAGVGADGLLALSRGTQGRIHPSILLVLTWACMYAAFTAIALAGPGLKALSPAQRTAMSWATAHTPAGSRFLVIAPAGDSAGSESEWFPALTGRLSLAAYQGTEWLKAARGPSPWARYDQLQACGVAGTGCLEQWARENGVSFSYVYVRSEGTDVLRRALLASPKYVLEYDKGGVLILAHRRRSGA